MVTAQTQTQSVLSVEIVDFSARRIHDMDYILEKLYIYIAKAIPDGRNTTSYRTWRSADGGGSLSFDFVQDSLQTAIQLSQLIQQHNSDEANAEQILKIRMGLHFGPIFRKRDYNDAINIWGHGITISTQVCHLAQPGEILASRRYCEEAELVDFNGRPHHEPAMPPLPPIKVQQRGRWWLKQRYSVEVYHLATANVNNQARKTHPWYTPFRAPIDDAIDTYSEMLALHDNTNEPKDLQNAFRAVMVIKRLFDLQHDEHNSIAVEVMRKVAGATENRISHLRHWLFSRLPYTDLEFWLRRAEFKTYPPNTTLFEMGQGAHYIYAVVYGTLHAVIGERVAEELHEGSIFGEMALFTPYQERTATVITAETTTVLRIHYEHLQTGHDASPPQNPYLNNALEEAQRIKRVLYRMLYIPRIIDNTLRAHHVFQYLTDEQLNTFKMLDLGVRLLPAHWGDRVYLNPDELWGVMIGLVVSGRIKATQRNGQFSAIYEAHDIIGLNGVDMRCPFDQLDLTPETQIILIPLQLLYDIQNIENEANEDYSTALEEESQLEANHKWYGTLEPKQD